MATTGRSYKPVIDNDKCNVCAVCIRGCPAEVIPDQRREEGSLRGRIYQEHYKEIKAEPLLDADKATDWAACQEACPLRQDIRGYIGFIADKKYKEALELIRETNSLPSATGYVCPHPCERACVRNAVDEPVSIRALKRFVADYDDGELSPGEVKRNGKKVTIIGSGPAGLAAAHDLTRGGYEVEIIEALDEPGGILRWSIPETRLPRNVLNRDIEYIKKMGITIRTGIKFGTDVTLAELKEAGADAVIMAIGHQKDLSWNKGNLPFNFSPKNTFIVDDKYMTNIDGVFAAGIAVQGPTTVVNAMASGKEAAKAVDAYL